jgi:hypothetical protein
LRDDAVDEGIILKFILNMSWRGNYIELAQDNAPYENKDEIQVL